MLHIGLGLLLSFCDWVGLGIGTLLDRVSGLLDLCRLLIISGLGISSGLLFATALLGGTSILDVERLNLLSDLLGLLSGRGI